MLPTAILRNCAKKVVSIELKNGETYNGTLVRVDTWMNTVLSDITWTSKQGDHFRKIREACIRGNSIRCFRMTDDALVVKKRPRAKSADSKSTNRPDKRNVAPPRSNVPPKGK